MQALEERDYFSDHSILRDPYAYFEAIRTKGPIHQLANGLVVVTGYDECLEVLKDMDNFSSVLAPQGPAAGWPGRALRPAQCSGWRTLPRKREVRNTKM